MLPPAAAVCPPTAMPRFTTEALHLESLLADYGVAVRVGQARLSARGIRFPLQLGLGTTPRRLLGLRERLAREAGYPHCRLLREGHTLFLELPREAGPGLRYGDLLALSGPPPADGLLLGLMEGGASLSLRLGHPSLCHVLLSGAEGCGKSELLRVMALGLAVHQPARAWRLAILGGGASPCLAPLRALPHCWGWSESPEQAIGWLVRVVTEIQQWEQQPTSRSRLLLLIDDAERLLEIGGRVARELLSYVLERGPEVGVHLALACRTRGALAELADHFPLQLEGVAPGRFQRGDVPLVAARLDEGEVRRVIARLWRERPRVVARRAERSLPPCDP